MNMGRDAVPALSQTKAVNQDKQNSNFLNYQIPDLTFLSKGQLRRTIEDLYQELNKVKSEKDFLSYNLLTLQKEKLTDQDMIISLQDEIQVLYLRINADSNISPLKVSA